MDGGVGGIYCPYLTGSLAVVWQSMIHEAINGAVADDGCGGRATCSLLRGKSLQEANHLLKRVISMHLV